jgi:B12 binding protein
MKVLLLSMPDYFEHMAPVAIRMPNGALSSLAGNVDDHHRVAVADLILCHRQVRETIHRLFHEFDPEVVGLSVMTFQRRTAQRIIDLARTLKPGLKIVVGGYDPSLAPEAYEGMAVDYIVRGEGEVTFRELVRALERGRGFESICGLSHREGDRWFHNPARTVHRLENGEIRPPYRAARMLQATPSWAAKWMWSRLRSAAHMTAVSAQSSKCMAATFTPIPLNVCSKTSAMPATTELGPSSW